MEASNGKSERVEAIWSDLDLNSRELSEEEVDKVKRVVYDFEEFAGNWGVPVLY